MCSVVVCESWRRNAQRFKLPEDPERRLEWVQFLAEVNGQRFRESSWTDIVICSEHFAGGSFENVVVSGAVRLKAGAVPTQLKPEEITEVAYPCDELTACDSRASCCEEPKVNTTGPQVNPESSDVSLSHSSDVPKTVTSGSGQMQQNILSCHLNLEKATLLRTEGKYFVNEKCLLQLFGRKCPSCGGKLQMEKVVHGVLVVLNQKCLRCEYRNTWKSQVSARDPAAGDQNLTGGPEVTQQAQQATPTDVTRSTAAVAEIITFSEEESDASDDGEEGEEDDLSSDGEWNPSEELLLAEELRKASEEETEDEGEEECDSPSGLKISELCTECGSFFNISKPHTCEHKLKPYSCNICGKRCVNEISLKTHSKIHDETYEHPCKYCYVTFKTRLDKLRHEQTHQDGLKPYKCPDCSETFSTSKKRRVHLAAHRGPRVFKCGVCGIEFRDVHHLRRHSVVHTGLKPFKCSVCQRGFSQQTHLKSHMRLHTGERPYKCQHCDKCFNHNVSLKSHVQRHHTPSSGPGRKKRRIAGRSDSNSQENGGKKDSEWIKEDDDDDDSEEKVDRKKAVTAKVSKRRTGRPRGRPKRNADGSLVPEDGMEEGLNAKTEPARVQKLKRAGSGNEEREDKLTESGAAADVAEEETQRRRPARGKSRGRPKRDSDSDFDPEEEAKKKRVCVGRTSGKPRGRPKNNLVV